jgi:hypothetical protein
MISSTMQLFARILNAIKIYIILEKKWPKDNSNVKDDPYEAPIFAYKEMDQLMEANIISSKVEEEDSIM